jgi:hypothetical protein
VPLRAMGVVEVGVIGGFKLIHCNHPGNISRGRLSEIDYLDRNTDIYSCTVLNFAVQVVCVENYPSPLVCSNLISGVRQ